MGILHSVDGVCFSVLSVGFASLIAWEFRKIVQTNGERRNFLENKVNSPSELLKDLENDNILSLWEACPDLPDEYKNLCILKGEVGSNFPLFSRISPETKAIYLKHIKRTLFSNNSSTAEEDTRIAPYFSLHDPYSSCLIRRAEKMQILSDLECLTVSRQVEKLSTWDKVWMTLGKIGGLVGFRGLKIGSIEGEIGITLGSTLMVYGEIIYNKATKSLRIEHPFYFFFKKSDVNKKYEQDLVRFATNVFFCSIFLGISVATLKSIIDRNKAAREQENENARSKTGKTENWRQVLPAVRRLTINDFKCRVCGSNPRNVILKPCLHFCVCDTCCMSGKAGTCPECNSKISEKVNIFFV